jgi:hypothetical protein
VLAVASLFALVGPEFTIAVVGAFLGIVGLIALQYASRWVARVETAIDSVEKNLAVNGDEWKLPAELRKRPLRSLVIWSVLHIGNNEDRWDEHLRDHEKGGR